MFSIFLLDIFKGNEVSGYRMGKRNEQKQMVGGVVPNGLFTTKGAAQEIIGGKGIEKVWP